MCFVNNRSIFVRSPKSKMFSLLLVDDNIFCIQSSDRMNFLAYHFVCSIEHQVVNWPYFLILIDFFTWNARPNPSPNQFIPFKYTSQHHQDQRRRKFFFSLLSFQIKVVFSLETRIHIVNKIRIIITPNIR